MKISDDEIIALMQNPQSLEKGLRVMMDMYQNRLYWHVRRILIDHETSQDVIQDTFIKVYHNFHQFKQDSKLYTWLYRIATNEALQQLNKKKKISKDEGNSEKYLMNLVSYHAEIDADRLQLILQKAIQTLPEKQKLVFLMRYYDDLPYDEISTIIDMSVGTLKTNYHYAKQKIESYILDHYQV